MARAYGYMAKKKESYKVEQVYSPVTANKVTIKKVMKLCTANYFERNNLFPIIFCQRFFLFVLNYLDRL